MAVTGNIPQTKFTSSDDSVREFFNNFYTAKLEFSSNEVDAVIAFFEKRGFESTAAYSISTILMQQAKIDNVPVFKLLDSLKGFNELQLSTLVTEILNYNRSKTSTLGFRLESQKTLLESRNVEVFETPEETIISNQDNYVTLGYVEPGYVGE
ncbi:MAG: hypothetical protein VW551_00045 [Euryarchaeota archaeon]|jgi:hypothetical protein